ncbi:universal stress protein [Leptolyngbya ohadii]|uniref:universal stress protein n=1 Tax=Leptolyngbya ohadii TaxID=1962290 RepID=UPI000B59A182|nr:universal stress protein [Leptolyngbya ohadii]
MLNKVLAAIDSSDLSDLVIKTLQQLSLPEDAQVVLAHVLVNSDANPDIAVDRPQVEREDISYDVLERLQTYQAALPYKSELEILCGEPAEEIVRLANIHHADLIVIGSRGLTGVTRILKGSVSSQVVEEASCSVLVVKPR